jgi:uncharacterized protein
MSDFVPIHLDHKSVFDEFLHREGPEISELTFTNLFMWRLKYRPTWRIWKDCLLIVMAPDAGIPFALPPVGPGNKADALGFCTDYLAGFGSSPRIARVSEDFVKRFVDPDGYEIHEDPENHDYVYLTQDLIELPGNKFHRKKNHLNRFVKNYRFEYRTLDQDLVDCVLRMQEDWCEMRECAESPDLYEEDRAVYEALTHFGELDFTGGAIVIDSKVEAFSLGEPLNPETAVIHIEKANPAISGLYAAINQRFCQGAWSGTTYINREQDLGVEGLRKAKQSYYPHHMVQKYVVTPRGSVPSSTR